MSSIQIERVHALEYGVEATTGDKPQSFLVRVHATTSGGVRVTGEGTGSLKESMNARDQRESWQALTSACRSLRGIVSLPLDCNVKSTLCPILSAEPKHEAARLAVLRATEAALRHARGEPDTGSPSVYLSALHQIRRTLWTPRLEPAALPKDLPVNEYNDQINLLGSPLSFSSFLLQQEALRRGLATVRYTRGDFTAVDPHGAQISFWRSLADTESPVSEFLCDQKQLTRKLLEAYEVPTAQGRVFKQGETVGATTYSESLGYPVVVKPQTGRKGRGVVTDISGPDQLFEAIESLNDDSRSPHEFIVERHLKGEDYRIYVAFGEVVSVVWRRPASVIGDGVRSVAELVAAKNTLRLKSTHTRTRPIRADTNADRMLRRQKFDWETIPPTGQEVVLASAANISQGGDSIEVIDECHPSFLNAAKAAVEAIPGLQQAGVDFLMPDHTRPIGRQGGGVCEINALASLMASQAPFAGKSQPVAARVVELGGTERGLSLTTPSESLCVEVQANATPDPRTLAQWITRQAGRLGLRGHLVTNESTDINSYEQQVTAIVAGPAPIIMRLLSGTTTGPHRRRPAFVTVTPVEERPLGKFEEQR